MLSQEIRRNFLHYFKSQGHTIVPSSPIAPLDDPTLLFTNAGMNQFKDVFLGQSIRSYNRATTTQKCIRVGGKHNDLDNVGHTSRHLTFFEMLGNFSFGDYFKKEAIGYAWDVSTHIFGFDPKKIWASVYKDDDEAFALWEKHLPAERIIRLGEKDNFWAMGDTGPCGPCSELLFDRGEAFGEARSPYDDLSGERYLEFWNLVFMQFMRTSSGEQQKLPKQSIDTGAGLERIASLKLGVDNLFLTDVLRSLIAQVEILSKKVYDENNSSTAPAFHVIADHIRSLSFAISDGVLPSNTDRGYVLRKILRRAVRYGRMLDLHRPFLADLLPRLIDCMGTDFPELKTAKSTIEEILTTEEESFLRNLQRGGQLLGQVIERSSASKKISGDDAFKLKDTYGFPLEEILLIAKDEHLEVDLLRFETLDEEAKEKSRKARKVTAQEFDQNFFSDFAKTHKPAHFIGYTHLSCQTHLSALVQGHSFVDTLQEGDSGMLLLHTTPFYAEMGGQVGDTGKIEKDGNLFAVEDTISPFPGIIAHLGKMEVGSLKKGDAVSALVDPRRRAQIENNHSATHLLHWALQETLGAHIKQAGSLVDDQRLRFDFNHHKALSFEELRLLEDLVNEKIRENFSVQSYELSYEEAQKRDEIKQFFGEKYDKTVRVVDMECSKELCGGTHTEKSGSIGLFKIAKESSISAGVRRIEALTGRYAEKKVQEMEDLLTETATHLKSTPQKLSERTKQLVEENRELSLSLKAVRKQQMKDFANNLLEKVQMIGSLAFLSAEIDDPSLDLSECANLLMNKMQSGILALGMKKEGRCQLLIQVSSNQTNNVSAVDLIKKTAPLIEGGGGGKPTSATAGGKNPSGLPKAFAKIKQIIEQLDL